MDEARNLANRYRLEAEVGSGPLASVYRAADLEGARQVAVKLFHPRFQADPRFAIRFRDHLKSIASLDHQNLVSVLDYGFTQGDFYMVTEWVDGSTLSTYFAELGVLSTAQAVQVGRQICAAVGAIHQHGLVHRDLKPENILLGSDGRVRVTDVGLTSLLSESGLSRTNVMLNGVGYMSPELARGEATGPAADIYSIGILLFEMVTDRLPFESSDTWSVVRMHAQEAPPSICQIDPGQPAELSHIVDRALQKEPGQRFASVAEMDAALARLPQGEAVRWPELPGRITSESVSGLLPLLMNLGKSARIRGDHLRATIAEGLRNKPPSRLLLAGQFLASFLIAFAMLFFIGERAVSEPAAPEQESPVQQTSLGVENYKGVPGKTYRLLAFPTAGVQSEDSSVESPTATPEAVSVEAPGSVFSTAPTGGGSGQAGGGQGNKGKGKGQDKGNKGNGKGNNGKGRGKGK